MDIGFLYRMTDHQHLGLMVKNIADLNESRYSVPEQSSQNNFTLPTYTTFGFSHHDHNWLFSVDNEFIYGRYGVWENDRANFWLIRGGIDKRINQWMHIRGGVIIPIIARTSSLGNIRDDLPDPKMGGTLGISGTYQKFTVDFAVYGDPARSYVEHKIYLKGVGSLTIRF
jgi:hypothetical protein